MEFLKPVEILNQLDLRKEMTAADFGCGSGGWVVPLAKRLEEGKVYAIDVLEEPISVLKSRKILNVETMIADVEKETQIPGDSCDLVLMTNLLFECEDKKQVLTEGKRVLKAGGKVLIVDWKIDAPLGPKEGRVSAGDLKKMARDLGLKIEKEFEAGTYHYGLIVVK